MGFLASRDDRYWVAWKPGRTAFFRESGREEVEQLAQKRAREMPRQAKVLTMKT